MTAAEDLIKPSRSRETGESTGASTGTSHSTPPPDEESAKDSSLRNRNEDGEGGEEDGDDHSSASEDDDFESEYDSAEERDAFSVGDEDSYSYASSTSSMLTDSQSVGSDMGSSAALTNMEENDTEAKTIAQREVRAARCGRSTALIFLAITLGVLLPFTMHRLATNQEEEVFQQTFKTLSDDIGSAWRENLARAFVALDAVAADTSASTSSTSLAASAANHSSWPQVVVPGFSIFSKQAQYTSSAIRSNSLAPIVTDLERIDYETHVHKTIPLLAGDAAAAAAAAAAAGNRIHSRNLQRKLQPEPADFSQGFSPQIFEVVNGIPMVAPGPGPYYPLLYIHPNKSQSVNYDLASNDYLTVDLQESTRNISAVLGKLLDDDSESNLLKLLLLPDDNSTQVAADDRIHGTMVYPILENLDANRASGFVLGSIVAVISWTDLFKNILPARAVGIVCVIQNSCGQVTSLQVDGSSSVRFLGFRDVHDDAFSSFRNTYDLLDLHLKGRTLAQISLSENRADTCQYELHVYPSAQTEEAYETLDPMIFAGISIGFFFLTLLVFLIYDCFLDRRNRAILASAIEARAIVSSLFPANVRDRLFETNRVKQKKKKKLKRLKKKIKKLRRKKKKKDKDGADKDVDKDEASIDLEKTPDRKTSILESVNLGNSIRNLEVALGNSIRDLSQVKGFVAHPKHQLKNLLANNDLDLNDLDLTEEFRLNKPIADLFPNTSVLFADIVGFTAWSSERAPEDVFTLLQTIYHAFDRIARRRGVFKVETIGDCYVAVTGLPEPQSDHPIRMTKFARECMTKMIEVTKKLEVSLGPDTGDLVLRLGINSGPVTAGVLQGEKSRFQLFGDTVNTASRMESTGERNKIHVSQSTADLLTKAGKGYWVKPRDDLVHAKGKGNVQTYWLVSRSDNFSIQANRSSDDLEHELGIKRVAPSRTRSMLSRGEPTRGVKRATSDSIKKIEKLSDSATPDRDDQREERLVQWQLEVFTQLLRKILAARDEALPPEEEKKTESWRGVAKSTNSAACSFDYPSSVAQSVDNSTALNITDHSVSLNSHASAIVDRFSQREVVGGPPVRLPRRGNSMRMLMPARQASTNSFDVSLSTFHSSEGDLSMEGDLEEPMEPDKIVVDEVVETICLPKFNPKSIAALEKANSVEVDEEILSQLKDYISTMALMYRQNPFHNFEHASHVTMSANKLLNRIVIPENVDYERETGDIAEDLHDYTYGITSDPLTQFAVVFSALVHDCDHTGVPNGQLGKEHPDMAEYYRNQSLAEQNSVDLAWDLFMDPRYKKLQNSIAATDEERKRFRQLVVNSVLATDIFDPKMKALRNQRWDKAFHRDPDTAPEITETIMEEDRNMKATIVIEHIIQASDVAHTMQHWHIYQKWNERLFNEMYSAFECGRSSTNPADGWYKGELWFFDNYVIPLAKKLEECNVFGVASDECLNYAQANRNEWCIKGEEVVAQMVERYQKRKFFVAGIAKKKRPNRRLSREAP